MALINQNDLEAKLGRSLTTDEASTFTMLNSANQAYVERLLNTSVEEVAATTRYYDGGVQHLAIDLCTDVTAFKYVDEDNNVELTLDTSDYTVEPINRTLKQQLRHRVRIPRGINNVSVTAKFSIYGDEGARNIVTQALIDMAIGQLTNNNDIKRESIEGYSVEYKEASMPESLKQLKLLIPPVL